MLSVRGKILQQVGVGRVLNRRTEVPVSLRQVLQIWEPRGGIIQIQRDILNDHRVVPIAPGRVLAILMVPGKNVG